MAILWLNNQLTSKLFVPASTPGDRMIGAVAGTLYVTFLLTTELGLYATIARYLMCKTGAIKPDMQFATGLVLFIYLPIAGACIGTGSLLYTLYCLGTGQNISILNI